MPNEVLYYNYILDLCRVVGGYVQKRALLNDIRKGEYASPGTILAIAKAYNGNIQTLVKSFQKDEKAVGAAWKSVKELLEDNGCYNDDDAKVFSQQMCKPENVCDFRDTVRRWCNSEIDKAGAGKEVTFYDLRGFLDRYEALLADRRKGKWKKKKKKK